MANFHDTSMICDKCGKKVSLLIRCQTPPKFSNTLNDEACFCRECINAV